MKRKSELEAVGVDPKKQKRNSESKLDSVPYDLKLDILTRLPAKSLANLRCVSKMWSSIIRTPEFIDSFFSISSTRPRRFIVGLSNGLDNHLSESLVFFFSFSPEDQEEVSSSVANFEIAIPSISFGHHFGYCTSLHGLLAVFGAGEGTRICNPCTEQVLKLPFGTSYVGYDPIGDHYKALAVYDRSSSKNDKACTGHKVLTLGKDGGWRHIETPPMPPHNRSHSGISINGFVYYAASGRRMNPGIVCFDVRSEKLTYIKAPWDAVCHGHDSAFLEYKGKLASIDTDFYGCFQTFDLWVLEDVQKHEWSNSTCEVPLSVWDFVQGFKMTFPGTNEAGEIIMAPRKLSTNGLPYYIFYYNVETHNIRRVRLRGIGDNQEYMRSYGFVDMGPCEVRIAPQHIESIAFFNNSITFPEF